MRLQLPWVDRLAEGLRVEDIETTHRVMAALRRALEREAGAEERA
jgi:hypothetical protein